MGLVLWSHRCPVGQDWKGKPGDPCQGVGRVSAPGAAELWVRAGPLRTERVVSKPGGVGSTCRDGVLQERQTHAQVAWNRATFHLRHGLWWW